MTTMVVCVSGSGSVMGLTGGGGIGRWGLLDMNNHKCPSRWLPVRLTSVKTSPSFRADKFHLQQKDRIQWRETKTPTDVKFSWHRQVIIHNKSGLRHHFILTFFYYLWFYLTVLNWTFKKWIDVCMKTKKGKTTNKYALTFAAREQQRADRNMISPVLVMAPQDPKFHLCKWQNIENEYSFSNST